jgi:hypothetical protein
MIGGLLEDAERKKHDMLRESKGAVSYRRVWDRRASSLLRGALREERKPLAAHWLPVADHHLMRK